MQGKPKASLESFSNAFAVDIFMILYHLYVPFKDITDPPCSTSPHLKVADNQVGKLNIAKLFFNFSITFFLIVILKNIDIYLALN